MAKSDEVYVALYARVSTAEQTTRNQLPELRAYAKQRGWIVDGEYIDENVSGATQQRPALDKLLADIRKGIRINAVVVVALDRYARSVSHLLSALDEFRSRKIHFVSLREAVDTSTPMGKMVFTVCAAVAELERALIRERVNAGIRRAKSENVRFGRPRCGFDYTHAIRLRNQGRSIREIAKALGVSRSTVQRTLSQNPQ